MKLSTRYLMKIGLLLCLTSVVWGCETGKAPQNKGNQNIPKKENQSATAMNVPIYVDKFVKNVNLYKNKLVTVRGVFMGWKGSCNTTPPETRSDWMIENNGVCIYVSGPTPMGIERISNSKDIGKQIDVRGRVLLTKSGTPYIKTISH